MSYHKINVCKHHIDSPWKIEEEMLEYIDAISTNNPVMAAQELSDLYGILERQAAKLGINMENLKTMSDLTKHVFESSTRVNASLYDTVINSSHKIGFFEDFGAAFMPNNFFYLFVKDACQFYDDALNDNIVVELVKGDFSVTINGDWKQIDKVNSLLLLDKNNGDTEFVFSDNTIIKVKYFDAIPSLDEFEGDDEVKSYIKHVCETNGSNNE